MKTIKQILQSPSLTSDLFARGMIWAILVSGLLLSSYSVTSRIPFEPLGIGYMLALDMLAIFVLMKFSRNPAVQDIIDFITYEAFFVLAYLISYLSNGQTYAWLQTNVFPYVTSFSFILTLIRLVWFFPNKSGTQTMAWPIMGPCGALSRHRRALPASERMHRWVVWGMIPLCFAVAVASTLVTFGWPSFCFAIVGIALVAGRADYVNNGLADALTERNSAVEAVQQFDAMMQSKDEAIEQLQARLSEELERISYTREEIIAFIDRKLTEPERRLLAKFALVDPRMHDTLIDFVVSFSKQPVPPDEPPPPKLTLVKGRGDTIR